MQETTLGRSGLRVSRIAFGTSQLGGHWGQFDQQAAVSAIRRARDLGVNFFDTAQAYGFGGCRGVDASLAALGVGYIDLYQVHWPDPKVPAAETAGALAELIATGKIRHAGVSTYNSAQIDEFSATLAVETLQPPYHVFRRDIEDDVLPYCHEHNIGVLVYGPLAHGLLTGTLTEDSTFAGDDWRSKSAVFQGVHYRPTCRRFRD
jgi:aryl-alcohol dehydrogenase-like predicted oxidoreductase